MKAEGGNGRARDRAPATLVLLCRPGFEKECSAEIIAALASAGIGAHCRAEPGDAWVEAVPDTAAAHGVFEAVSFRNLVFTRDWLLAWRFDGLAAGDRVAPLLEFARRAGPYRECWLENADTEDGRSLGRLCARLRARFEGALRESRLLAVEAAWRFQVLFLSGTQGYAGVSPVANGARWPMGIPRLKLGGAPSRSAAKLEEAMLWFLGDAAERELVPGMRAVDLGAAPGGWTWQFVRRGIHVVAVDRGDLRDDLRDSALVRHLREDAFRYRPERTVDWLVCDVVDKPARVCELMGLWLASGWCRRAIFNLKLPMKRRHAAAAELLAYLRGRLEAAARPFRLEARQLYHDREEITVYARLA